MERHPHFAEESAYDSPHADRPDVRTASGDHGNNVSPSNEDNTVTHDNDDVTETRIRMPGRVVVVEPVLAMAGLFGFPVSLMSSMYIVQHVTVTMAHEHGYENFTYDDLNASVCVMNKSTPAYAFREAVQARSAYFNLLLVVASTVPAFFTTLFLGAYSDKAGRRYAILPPLVGALFKTLSFIIVIAADLPIEFLLIGALLDGMGGFFITLLMGCFSYIADTTTKDHRMFRIFIAEMCIFVSAMFGPIGVGYYIEQLGYMYAFMIALAGQILALAYAFFFIPETIPKDPTARCVTLEPFRNTAKVFTVNDENNRRWKLCILMIAFVACCIPNMDFGISTLYEMNVPLCWSSVMIGYFSAVYIGVAVLGGGVSARLLKRCLGDEWIAMIACMFAVIGSIYIFFVQNTIMMFIRPVFAMLAVLYIPTTRVLLSKLVTEREQGAVFGAVAAAEVACQLLGSSIFNPIYAATLHLSSAFVFLVMAAFYAVGNIFIGIYIGRSRLEQKSRNYRLLIQEDLGEPADDGEDR